jgi:hypothetical protein
MSDSDAMRALVAANPIAATTPEKDDDVLLRSIVSQPREPRRRPRRGRLLVGLVAAVAILAVAGFTIASHWVGQSSLPDLLRSARSGVPLPAGVAWSDADVPRLVSDETVDQATFPRDLVLIEAQCRWERAWSDALTGGNASAAATADTGLVAIRGLWADLYPANPNGVSAATLLDPVIAAGRRGDTGPLRAQLALCPSWLGGTWTARGEIDRGLRQETQPAIAVVLPLSSRVGDIGDEHRWQDVIARLRAYGIGEEGGGFSGGGVAVAYANGDDLQALIATTRKALAGAEIPAGSTLRTWDPAARAIRESSVAG